MGIHKTTTFFLLFIFDIYLQFLVTSYIFENKIINENIKGITCYISHF